jgi:hypothetical protein
LKFLHLFNKSSSAAGFAKIQGYEDIKDIVRRALESDENYNLLFVGTPASSKTLFLQGILELIAVPTERRSISFHLKIAKTSFDVSVAIQHYIEQSLHLAKR